VDPDACLEELRALVRAVQNGDVDENTSHEGVRLAELFYGLDCWLSAGGFLPGDWSP
jgi:hypothetical protein